MSLRWLHFPSNLLGCELLCPFYRWEDRSLEWLASVLPSVSSRTEYLTQTHMPCPLHLSASGSMNSSAWHSFCVPPQPQDWAWFYGLSYSQAWHYRQGAGRLLCHLGTCVVRSRTRARCKEFSLSFDAWDLRPGRSQGMQTGFVGCLLWSQWGQFVLCIFLHCCQFYKPSFT